MSKEKKTVVSDADIDRAIREGKAHDRDATKISEASYDRQRDALIVRLSTGTILTIPRAAVPHVNAIMPDTLGEVEVEAPGYSVWFAAPDVGVRIETLLDAALGSVVRDIAARMLGASKSAAKAAAVRANGRKGGRPRKKTKTTRAKR